MTILCSSQELLVRFLDEYVHYRCARVHCKLPILFVLPSSWCISWIGNIHCLLVCFYGDNSNDRVLGPGLFFWGCKSNTQVLYWCRAAFYDWQNQITEWWTWKHNLTKAWYQLTVERKQGLVVNSLQQSLMNFMWTIYDGNLLFLVVTSLTKVIWT